MKNKIYLVMYGLAMFTLGGLITFGCMMSSDDKSTDNSSLKSSKLITDKLPSIHNSQILIASQVATSNEITSNQEKKTSNTTFNTQALSQEHAQQLIKSMPDSQLNDYVGRFMSAKDAELISDKRQFANRALEELYKPNDNQPLVGQVLLSESNITPNQSINTDTLQKHQKLYAHLNTFGKVPLGANVFVKWVNRNTGEVLLFEKKLILPNSNNNWVSYQPYDGWQPGSYDIRFYQFTSKLEPVAQISYSVNQVIE